MDALFVEHVGWTSWADLVCRSNVRRVFTS